MSRLGDRRIRWTTTGCVGLLVLADPVPTMLDVIRCMSLPNAARPADVLD